MSAHTPGPWKVEDDGREVVVYAVEGSCRVASIELDNLDDRSHALRDARLIAAAPDLLEAARESIARCKFDCSAAGHCGRCEPLIAAIAKAEGRS